MQVLVFEIGGMRYGLLVSDVREVVRAVTIAPLPKAPSIVEGLINVRGTLVPVLDMRTRFRVPRKAASHTDQFVIASAGPRLVAIRVERVHDLVDAEASNVEEVTAVVSDAAYVSGIAKLPDGLVLIHDLRTFLEEAESIALDDAMAGALSGGDA